MKSTTFAMLVVAGLVSGCASRGPVLPLTAGEYTQVRETSLPGLPAPSPQDVLTAPRPYLIGPLDRLRVEVFGMDNMTREIQADTNGQISVPLVGVVNAAGQTPRQLEVEIAQRLRQAYVRDPQVSVNVLETMSQFVTVDGSVEQPGRYPVTGRMTLVRAIASAKGTSEFAREGSVLVFRRVGNQDLVGLYNLRSIRQGLYPDPEIFANDVIVVDESRARRLFRDIVSLAPVLTAPLIAVLQN